MAVKLSKKQRKALYVVLLVVGMYLIFKYLLPLAAPFIAAYLITLMILPGVEWMHKKLRLKKVIAAGLYLFFICAVLIGLCFLGGKTLWIQLQAFISKLPVYLEYFNEWLKNCCSGIESMMKLEDGVVFDGIMGMTQNLNSSLPESIMKYLMGNSIPVVQLVFVCCVIISIVLISVIYIINDWERITLWKSTSIYRSEILLISSNLSRVGRAYFGTQFILMVITAFICTIGLWLTGSPYALLLGIGIGLLDALPLLGTGLVFFPWIFLSIAGGDWIKAAQLGTIYLICYFVREFMEAKLMGTDLGVRPLGILIALYIGLKLFGFLGFILGPIAYIMLNEILKIKLED